MTRLCDRLLPDWLARKELTPEFALLLAAARVTADDASPDWERAVAERPPDWDRLLSAAAAHAMQPLLARFLLVGCRDALAPELLATLHQVVTDNLIRSLQKTGELWEILELFADEGISAVPFKGPTLAMLLYDDPAWRQYGDLDLLIDRRDLTRASELLRARGYRVGIDWAATQDERFQDAAYSLEFKHQQTLQSVELHWELFHRSLAFGFHFEQLRQRLIPVAPGGKPMLTLGPEDLLLYLCAHGAKHCWAKLGWIADVARLIERYPNLDWRRVLAQAREQKIERLLLLGLLLAGDLLDAPLPAEIRQRVDADRSLPLRAAEVGEWVMTNTDPTFNLAAQFAFYLKLQEGLADKVRYLFRLLANPNVGDWEFMPLSARWFFIYLAMRPARLIGKYARLLTENRSATIVEPRVKS